MKDWKKEIHYLAHSRTCIYNTGNVYFVIFSGQTIIIIFPNQFHVNLICCKGKVV